MKPFRQSPLLRLFLIVPMLCLGLIFSAPTANAGYFNDVYDGIKAFSELPTDMNQLKKEYENQAQKLSNAEATLQTYQSQNEALVKQNKELTETVKALNAAQEAREATTHKLRILLYTAIGLFIGYFIFMRVLRMVLRK